jgi:hypothetical protein
MQTSISALGRNRPLNDNVLTNKKFDLSVKAVYGALNFSILL